ncbi:hypothetical protein JHK82_024979 [Glycine max]|uniref:Uncharacterized protein n=1 Tax=Glycine soja TaxID=3848 RepID=A0A445J0H9_GLYSO|nr:hypothetical protein JHK82_024979 [Glycine max]RZB91868.1 hypothetical protein D0Y65_024039 [Glycine soja]
MSRELVWRELPGRCLVGEDCVIWEGIWRRSCAFSWGEVINEGQAIGYLDQFGTGLPIKFQLFGVISFGKGKHDKLLTESSRKIDAIRNRLTVLDMKLDSKPSYVETFAIGLALGATLKGIGAIAPHIIASLFQIWNSVSTATKSSPQ